MPRVLTQTLYDYCMKHPEVKHLLDEYSPKNKKSPYEVGINVTQYKSIWYCSKCDYEWEEYTSCRKIIQTLHVVQVDMHQKIITLQSSIQNF